MIEPVASLPTEQATRNAVAVCRHCGEMWTNVEASCDSCGAQNTISAIVRPGPIVDLRCTACGSAPEHLACAKCESAIDSANLQPVISGMRPLLRVIALLSLLVAAFLAVKVGLLAF